MKKKITSIIMIFVLSAAASVSAADISAGNGKITASDVTEGSSLITALYRDGVMVQSKLHKGSGTITADPAADFGELSNTDTIKAFLWDMEEKKRTADRRAALRWYTQATTGISTIPAAPAAMLYSGNTSVTEPSSFR